MHHAATHDHLTGCPNRKALVVDLATALARLREFGEPSALIFIDLDRFKQVNDEDGHAVGDQFLRLVAEQLRTCVRNDDTVARFGGDEFVVLLKNCPQNQAQQLARTIVEELGCVQLTGRHSTHVGSASLGLVCTEDASVGSDEWLARADESAYAAKRAGGGRAFVWQPDGNVPLVLER